MASTRNPRSALLTLPAAPAGNTRNLVPPTATAKTLAILVATGFAAAVPAQKLLQSKDGIQAGEYYGSALAAAGDVDRDGHPDWIVGAPKNSYGLAIVDRGIVIVVSGKDGSWLANAVGPRLGMRLGWSVAGVGDVNGDGCPDFAAGGAMDTAGGGAFAGYAGVWSGKDQSRLWDRTGEPGSRFGHSICGIGDVDRDGHPDVAIGAPENSSQKPFGCVYVHSGRTGALITELRGRYSGAAFGSAVANAGDVDGDRKDDLIVGEARANDGGPETGRVWVFSTRSVSMPEVWHRDGILPGSRVGTSVSGGGDIDGDGVPDVVAGGPGTGSGPCRVEVIAGRTGTLIRRHDDPSGTGYGFCVAVIGDMDRDGRAEYAVGAPDWSSGAGLARVYHSGGQQLFARNGAAGDKCGYALAGVGDVNRDGRPDLAIGSPLSDAASADAGRVEVRGLTILGNAELFGTGCRTTAGAPLLTCTGLLHIGGQLQLLVSNAQGSAGGILLLSGTDTSWQGLRLPYDLSVLGMTGCQLLVGMDLTIGLVTNASGSCSQPLRLPNLPTLAGQKVFAQAAVQDVVNAGKLVTSNGLAITIGN